MGFQGFKIWVISFRDSKFWILALGSFEFCILTFWGLDFVISAFRHSGFQAVTVQCSPISGQVLTIAYTYFTICNQELAALLDQLLSEWSIAMLFNILPLVAGPKIGSHTKKCYAYLRHIAPFANSLRTCQHVDRRDGQNSSCCKFCKIAYQFGMLFCTINYTISVKLFIEISHRCHNLVNRFCI